MYPFTDKEGHKNLTEMVAQPALSPLPPPPSAFLQDGSPSLLAFLITYYI